jgi:hypothetical protein
VSFLWNPPAVCQHPIITIGVMKVLFLLTCNYQQ